MDLYRTPDQRFDNLPGFNRHPSYADLSQPEGESGDPIRMAYIDAGSEDGPVALLLHGEPTWSFLYRHVIDVLVESGVRCIVPDLIGFGRSDKPVSPGDHSYARHVEWVRELAFDHLDLHDVTLVGQDWGGLIGLRLATEHPDRFARLVAANTGLPTGDFKMPDIWWMFREAVEKAETLDVGRLVESGCVRGLSADDRAGYDAPFPDEASKAGPRVMPSLVPNTPDDPASVANRAAWERLGQWRKPFLTAFGDSDPITGAMGPILRELIPGAHGLDHTVVVNAGHFIQEDAGTDLGTIVASFIHKG